MIILDTHTWWWAVSEPEKLSPKAMSIVQETPPGKRGISAISIWEFAMMATRGRIELIGSPKQWLELALSKTGIQVLHIKPDIALDACTLPGDFHKDPCDRIIVATARCNNCALLTADQKILSYRNVSAIW